MTGCRSGMTHAAPAPRRCTRLVIALAVTTGLALILFANAHLVYVAVISQPECVATMDSGGPKPAKVSC